MLRLKTRRSAPDVELQQQLLQGVRLSDEAIHTILSGETGKFHDLPIIQRCLKLTQGRLESLPTSIVDDNGNPQPIPSWLTRPSFRTLSVNELIGEAVYALMMTGGWILLPIRAGGEIVELFSFAQSDFTIQDNNRNDATLSTSPVQYFLNGVEIPPEQLSHVKWMVRPNQVKGISAIASAKFYFNILRNAYAFTEAFYKKGATTQMILTSNETVGDQYMKQLEDAMKGKTGGVDNAWKVLMFDGGVKPVPIGVTQENAQFIDTIESYNRYIATHCFGIPAAVVDLEKSGSIAKYSNPAGRQWQLWEDTLRTVVVKIETAIQ